MIYERNISKVSNVFINEGDSIELSTNSIRRYCNQMIRCADGTRGCYVVTDRTHLAQILCPTLANGGHFLITRKETTTTKKWENSRWVLFEACWVIGVPNLTTTSLPANRDLLDWMNHPKKVCVCVCWHDDIGSQSWEKDNGAMWVFLYFLFIDGRSWRCEERPVGHQISNGSVLVCLKCLKVRNFHDGWWPSITIGSHLPIVDILSDDSDRLGKEDFLRNCLIEIFKSTSTKLMDSTWQMSCQCLAKWSRYSPIRSECHVPIKAPQFQSSWTHCVLIKPVCQDKSIFFMSTCPLPQSDALPSSGTIYWTGSKTTIDNRTRRWRRWRNVLPGVGDETVPFDRPLLTSLMPLVLLRVIV